MRKQETRSGKLIIIGGRKDKSEGHRILGEVVREVGDGKLVIATVATRMPLELWQEYYDVFTELGVKNCQHLLIENRLDALKSQSVEIVDGAKVVFFTGGNQLKITSELGGTSVCDSIHRVYDSGGVIAGTSAGASAMSETMLLSSESDESPRVGKIARMAPGLGFIHNIIIDQHFARRNRVSRLIGVVAQNPCHLGVGIDENTAIVLTKGESFQVIGEGAVYVVDAHESTDTNIADGEPDQTLSVFDLKVHVLSEGNFFEMESRRPRTRALYSVASAV